MDPREKRKLDTTLDSMDLARMMDRARKEGEAAGYARGVEALRDKLLKNFRGGGPEWADVMEVIRVDAAALLPPSQGEAGAPSGAVEVEPGLYVFPNVRSAFDDLALPAPSPGVEAKDCVHGDWTCQMCDWYYGYPRLYIESRKGRP